jgi:hypothetical protein
LWCGGGHLHRECPEKTLSCCNCTLEEGEKPHPASYQGCSHVKGKLQWRRASGAPKGSSGRTFFSKFTSPELHCVKTCNISNHQVQSNSDMLKVTTVMQQIMTELNIAVSEKDKIMVITDMVLNLMKQNGCYNSSVAHSHSI